jgi:hypothetical protein
MGSESADIPRFRRRDTLIKSFAAPEAEAEMPGGRRLESAVGVGRADFRARARQGV